MSLLVQEMIKDLLPEGNRKTTAVYGGGFKPPTKGHFEVVTTSLKKNSNIDEFIILIGGKERDGITQSDSLLIWDIYKQYLPINVNVITDSKPPIQGVYNYAKEHPNEDVIFVIGAREGNEEDFTDITNRTKSVSNYPNLRVETVITQGGVSGTAARNAAKISLEKFKQFVPSQLSDEEVEEVFDIVSQNIKEILNENASYSENINLKREIAKLTKHMIDKGMNIQPLPKLVFKNGDSENAKQFLGKTAYYDPNSMSIVLYTEGRHPKDIVRSFSHEMVHHTQNLEGRLGDISTTNTMEDDNIDKLEQEANLKGTMTFRNWTDSLNEGKQVSTIYHYTTFEAGLKILQSNQFRSGEAADSTKQTPIFAVSFTRDKRFHDSHVVGFDESSFGNKPQLRFTIDGNKLSNRFSVQPHSQGGAFSKNRKGFEAEERVVSNKPFTIPLSDYLMSVDVLLEYKKTSNEYDILSIVDYEMYAPLRAKIIKFAQDKNLPINLIVNKNGDPWPDKVKNTLIQKILDWFTMKEANLKGTMTFRNWTDSLNEGKNKDPFGINAYAMELGKLREEEIEYKIYLDMDGVVADFDKRFKDLSGMSPEEFESKYSRKDFWDFIDEKHKVSFWRGIELMPGAQELIDYVSKHDYEMLTAPSLKKQSVIGKSLWIKDQVGTLFSSTPKVNYRQAKLKHLIKPELTKFDILIDDRQDTINRWNSAGGTGIFHTSAGNTISQLKKLKL